MLARASHMAYSSAHDMFWKPWSIYAIWRFLIRLCTLQPARFPFSLSLRWDEGGVCVDAL